jgi:soluble lytic murein transglycosylase
MAARLDMYLFAMTTARRALARTNSSEARARLWRYVYALGHYDLIGPAAETNGLDPMLVSALIRQESLFDARAVSRAGARGLMQLMLPTARQVARSRSEPAPTADDLFRPELSVRYGTHYLREKLAEFGDRVDVALSAYNAGEGKAEEWASLLTTYDPDLFRELIDYSETKDYVRRVQYNRATFHLFYDPRPRSR